MQLFLSAISQKEVYSQEIIQVIYIDLLQDVYGTFIFNWEKFRATNVSEKYGLGLWIKYYVAM